MQRMYVRRGRASKQLEGGSLARQPERERSRCIGTGLPRLPQEGRQHVFKREIERRQLGAASN